MISVDINSMVQDLQLTKRELDQVRELVIKAYVTEVYDSTVDLAFQRLGTSRGEYLSALKIIKESKYTYSLVLEGSRFAAMIELGCAPFDMKCIVSPHTKIYTSKGYKKIIEIKNGDKVLTHKGKFKKVCKIFKEENKDDFIYKIKPELRESYGESRNWLCITKNHPILTNNGWKKAEDLNPETDKLIVTARRCKYCNELYACLDIENENGHCSRSCVGKKCIELGILNEWLQKNAKGNCNWGFSNFSKEKRKEILKAITKNRGNKIPSNPEEKLWKILRHFKYKVERQYQFKRNKTFKHSKRPFPQQRYFYFDFAIPEHKICIEVNGEYWHTEKQIKQKQEEIESHGWTYIGFWSKEIYKNLSGCILEIVRILNNHTDNYEFIETSFKKQKVSLKNTKKFCTTYGWKYNLTVEDDSSYVAAGIVTHNSGFANSSKKISLKDGGWYLTIPLLFRTPNAVQNSGELGQILPRRIYDLIRNLPTSVTETSTETVSTLAGKDVPQEYQPPYPRQLKELNSKVDQYIPKSSIYAGLIRIKDKQSGQSSYNTFRRVSNNSDSRSWMHPGIRAYNLIDQAVAQVDQLDIAETALQKFFPNTTLNIRVHGELALEMNAKYNETLGKMNEAIGEQIKNILK